jgi:SulP family sulfate permease
MWIFIWVTLSLALFIYRSMRPRLIEVAMYKDWQYRDKASFALKTSKHVSVFRFDWVLFFANAWYFESTILDFISKKEKLKYVIFDLEWMSDIDSSWLEVLEHLHERLDEENWVKVYFSSLRVKVIQKFIDSGFLKYFWKKNIFVKVKSALKRIEEREWDDVDLDPLWEYCPDDTDNEEFDEEWKDILKKYVYKK